MGLDFQDARNIEVSASLGIGNRTAAAPLSTEAVRLFLATEFIFRLPEDFIQAKFGFMGGELDLVPTTQETSVSGHEKLQGTPAIELKNEGVPFGGDSYGSALPDDTFDKAVDMLHGKSGHTP